MLYLSTLIRALGLKVPLVLFSSGVPNATTLTYLSMLIGQSWSLVLLFWNGACLLNITDLSEKILFEDYLSHAQSKLLLVFTWRFPRICTKIIEHTHDNIGKKIEIIFTWNWSCFSLRLLPLVLFSTSRLKKVFWKCEVGVWDKLDFYRPVYHVHSNNSWRTCTNMALCRENQRWIQIFWPSQNTLLIFHQISAKQMLSNFFDPLFWGDIITKIDLYFKYSNLTADIS